MSYTSLTCGQKMDTALYKRPQEARVPVSLNGKVLEIPPVDGRSPAKKYIHQAAFLWGQKTYNSYSGNMTAVEDSIKNATSTSFFQTRAKKVASKRNPHQLRENMLCAC